MKFTLKFNTILNNIRADLNQFKEAGSINAATKGDAAIAILKRLGYNVEEWVDPNTEKLNKQLRDFEKNWKFTGSYNPMDDEEEKAYKEYDAYVADLAKEFKVSNRVAANINFASDKKWYRPEMLPVLLKFDKGFGGYQPNLTEMRWIWKDGEFFRKPHPPAGSSVTADITKFATPADYKFDADCPDF